MDDASVSGEFFHKSMSVPLLPDPHLQEFKTSRLLTTKSQTVRDVKFQDLALEILSAESPVILPKDITYNLFIVFFCVSL